jgi:hypothetical protein
MFEIDSRYQYRKMIIDKQILINITKEKLALLNESKIMFIEVSNEGIIYLMDTIATLFCIKLDENIKREDLYNILPEYKKASVDNQEVYTGINLGMGHALLIKTSIYKEYMNLLKVKTQSEEQNEEYYNAYCYWMDIAINFLNNRNSRINGRIRLLEILVENLDGLHCVIGESYCNYGEDGYIDEFYVSYIGNEEFEIFYDKKTYNYSSFEKLTTDKIFNGKSIRELIDKIYWK